MSVIYLIYCEEYQAFKYLRKVGYQSHPIANIIYSDNYNVQLKLTDLTQSFEHISFLSASSCTLSFISG